ncbi:helix-turn-helix domain-containing protein [Subtercola endophyticus]|uniref:helix-turn-helix domain-containing protein n=1 Tax=Subtercola endophyticus TaxID=2895559 RepID=UPI001E4D7AB9|nr:helix-turn-helix transcriptional regulator [Subtercola endophyticus]UFS59509.1 helix-turn-helix domain-containing protein [Subtercola endophyticus]
MPTPNVGARIKEARKVLGMSAEALADKTGSSRSVIANIENGRKSEITVSELVRFAIALECSALYLAPELDPVVPHGRDVRDLMSRLSAIGDIAVFGFRSESEVA